MEKKRLVVLASGNGTNFQAIAHAVATDLAPFYHLVALLCDRKKAFVLTRAKALGVPFHLVTMHELERSLKELAPDLICLAGFMRILPNSLVQSFKEKVINIHPSLLPSFPGLSAIEQAFEHGVRWTGCTVHFVDAGIDTGPILMQHPVPILKNDTPQTLRERVQRVENKIYVEALRKLAKYAHIVEKRRVLWIDRERKISNESL